MDKFLDEKLFQILLILLSFTQLNSQNMSLTNPICNDDGTATFSVYANITDYLLNNNNIDKREFIKTPEELKDKKIGILPGNPINESDYGEVIELSTTEDLINALKNHTIDGIVTDKSTRDYILLHNYDIDSLSENSEEANYGPIFQNNSQFQESFNQFASKTNLQYIFELWDGINYDAQKIDKNFNGNNGTIKATAYLGNRPYAYEDENGEPVGSCIDIIYRFAKDAGYKVEFNSVNSYEEQINAIKEKSADMTCGYINDSSTNDEKIGLTQYFYRQHTYSLIRLSNSEASNETEYKKYYEKYEDLDGEKLGALRDSFLVNVTKSNFSNSEILYYNDSFLLYKGLFLGEIEGFLSDNPSAENFQHDFPDKVSYFEKNFYENYYGFAFNKNNSKLVNDMNSYLRTKDLMNEYPKWNIRDTSNLTVNKSLNQSAPKIRVAMFPNTKPICFRQNNEIIGYEILLLYEFARQQNYNIEFITLENSADRINYILEDKADITGGALNIIDETKKLVSFSYPTLSADTALVVSKEKRKLPGKIEALDVNYNEKLNNTIYFPVKVGDKDKDMNCNFNESYAYYNYTLINCTILNLEDAEPTKNGLIIGNSTDTLKINNVEYNPNNLLNGNSLTGRPIIVESNKTDCLCLVANPSIYLVTTTTPSTIITTTATTTVTTTITTTTATTYISTIPTIPTIPTTILENGNLTLNYRNSSKNRISSGVIIGIIIPCAVVLVAAAIGAFLCRRERHIAAPSYAQRLDRSEYKLNVRYPNQQVQEHKVPVNFAFQGQQIFPAERTQQALHIPSAIIVKNP